MTEYSKVPEVLKQDESLHRERRSMLNAVSGTPCSTNPLPSPSCYERKFVVYGRGGTLSAPNTHAKIYLEYVNMQIPTFVPYCHILIF